jgi:hypothetical protein
MVSIEVPSISSFEYRAAQSTYCSRHKCARRTLAEIVKRYSRAQKAFCGAACFLLTIHNTPGLARCKRCSCRLDYYA